MPGHAPYLMPDGQTLSKYLTLEAPRRRKKGRRKSHQRGKDEIWEHLKKQQSHAADSGYHSEHDEFGIAEKMGSRRRTRWINDRMLRDMTGPMTMDQIEAQFCPPPWGDIPTKKDAFHLLFDEHHSLWEVLRNIDLSAEQKMIHDMEQRTMSGNSHTKCQDGAKEALKSWHSVSRRLRRFMKTSNPMIVLEAELRLIEFKNGQSNSTPDAKDVLELNGQSRYMLLVYEALCQFHRLKFSREARMIEDEDLRCVYDLRIKRRGEPERGANDMEVTCSDLLMALEETKSIPLNAKTLRNYVMTHIHGIEESQ